MKIKTWIKYMEGYLPTPRCRKQRYRECEDYIEVELTEIKKDDIALALQVGEITDYYLYNDMLFTKATYRDVGAGNGIEDPIEYLKYVNENCSSYFGFDNDDTRKKMINKAENEIKQYVLVDGELYYRAVEPVYAVYCFGCSNNHGGTLGHIGTSLSITEYSIAKRNSGMYFNAFDRELAIKSALEVAERRGDTYSIDYIKNTPEIKVIIPSVIKAETNTNN